LRLEHEKEDKALLVEVEEEIFTKGDNSEEEGDDSGEETDNSQQITPVSVTPVSCYLNYL